MGRNIVLPALASTLFVLLPIGRDRLLAALATRPAPDFIDVFSTSVSEPSTYPSLRIALIANLGLASVYLALAYLFSRHLDRPSTRGLGFTPTPLSPYLLAQLTLGSTALAFGSIAVTAAVFPESLGAEPWQWKSVGLLLSLLALLIAEECAFRGYLQRRLLRQWPPALAIGATSIVFVLAHGSTENAICVGLGSLWFGYTAWRSDSTGIGIYCHIATNTSASLIHSYFGPVLSATTASKLLGLGIGLLLALGLSSAYLQKRQR